MDCGAGTGKVEEGGKGQAVQEETGNAILPGE